MIEELKIVQGYKPYIKLHSFPQVRCSFWLLAWANSCMYNCAYCWLKAGYHRWSWNEDHIAEKPALKRILERFCARKYGSHLLNAGELSDSFILPGYIPLMAGILANEKYDRHNKLLLVTKWADPKVLLENDLHVPEDTLTRRLTRKSSSYLRRWAGATDLLVERPKWRRFGLRIHA